MDFDFDEIPLGQIMGQFIPGGGFPFGPQFGPPQGPGFGPPGMVPGGPPFGPPAGGPGFGPPSGGPGFGPPGGGQGGPPQGTPPTFTPPRPQQAQGIAPYAVDPGAIRPCLFRYVYIWLRNGRSFWAYLVFVGRESAAGWRWNGFRWVYFGIDLNRIDAFVCY